MWRHALFAFALCAGALSSSAFAQESTKSKLMFPRLGTVPPPPADDTFPGGLSQPPATQSTGTVAPPCDNCPPGYQPIPIDKVIEPPSRYPTIPRLTGFFHLDAGWFAQDPTNIATVGDDQDGIDFRRARLAGVGNVTENVSYHLEFDIATSQALFVDDFVNFANVPLLGNIRVGRWRQPFGMSALTGIRELPFLERATQFAFVPFRQTGIGAFDTALDERMTWAVSAYRYPTFAFGNNVGDAGGWGMTGRVTFLPYYEDEGERVIHVGFDYSFDDPSNNQLRFQNTPEIFVGENAGNPVIPGNLPVIQPYVDTGVIPTRTLNLLGVEAAAAFGPFYVQSEAYWAMVRMSNGNTETLPGAYAQARWILTGERLPYLKNDGVFGRVVPHCNVDFKNGGIGAWELAARWSYIDLNGTGFVGPGRQLNDFTMGLNWYLNGYTKVQFNYIHAFLKDAVFGKSDADIFAVRTQVDF